MEQRCRSGDLSKAACLTALALVGCSSSSSRTDAGRLDAGIRDAGNDASDIDSGYRDAGAAEVLAACGENHTRVKFQFPGEDIVEECATLTAGVQARYEATLDCPIGSVTSPGHSDWLTVNFGMDWNPFGPEGPAAGQARLLLESSIPPLCEADEFCAYAENLCGFEVSQVGSLGDLVELRLARPCVLSNSFDPDNPRRPTVLGLTVRGVLTPEGPPPDAGVTCP